MAADGQSMQTDGTDYRLLQKSHASFNNKGKAILFENTSVDSGQIEAHVVHAGPCNPHPDRGQPNTSDSHHVNHPLYNASTTIYNEVSFNNKGKQIAFESTSVDSEQLQPEIVHATSSNPHCEVNEAGTSDPHPINQPSSNASTTTYSQGTLGAIVFESGANSQTDYDVIVEYKDTGPKRINKLHSSYMSLQMAESNIKAIQPSASKQIVEVEANIRDLRPRERNKIIYAKVYRAWIARDPPDTTEKGFRVILLEKQGVRFTCEGTITHLNTSRDWCYPACPTCNQKVENNSGLFDCKIHGPVEHPSYRYNFKAYLNDGTATVMITFFSPKAKDIVGVDCDSLLSTLDNPNPKNIPTKIQEIIGKRHIFQFHYNTASKQAPPDFIFNDLLDNQDAPKQIEYKSSGTKY
ncbi:nucleic acid-binding, OB-fold protein [Artemisia annua]|uniref:Nucleic acid-binding, OB-fold protein n=1 Tax=Artemisia annua TaxID=35608 RepID=A0A2U1MLP9_ARTAN|nr:nucleic acid-binding, OB-fold protein [Artemisia annua]